MTALIFSPLFDFRKTYFFIAGIAGINPKVSTICSVGFARYAVQVGLQYEFDAREIPQNFSTGYFPQGSISPSEYPQTEYGTEVFEVNVALRDIAIGFAKTAKLNDSTAAQIYRAKYAMTSAYMAGAEGPSVLATDVATSDVYFSGTLLGEAFENTTKLFTNGSGVYGLTAQEDNATLEALLRGALNNLTDFSRIIVMRTASDFDRPYSGESDLENLGLCRSGRFRTGCDEHLPRGDQGCRRYPAWVESNVQRRRQAAKLHWRYIRDSRRDPRFRSGFFQQQSCEKKSASEDKAAWPKGRSSRLIGPEE